MRLIHKNLRHTGYIIAEYDNGDVKILPAFSDYILTESQFLKRDQKFKLKGLYGAQLIMKEKLESIQEYFNEHGVIPQDLTEELRTGFENGRGLTQSYPRYYYK